MPVRVLAWPAFRNRRDNPYNFLLYKHLQKLGVDVLDLGDLLRKPDQIWRTFRQGVDILHIHWPEFALGLPPFRMASYVVALFTLCMAHRLRGGKVVWTVHNLSPHEDRYPFLGKWFYKMLARIVDGLIFLSETSLTLFQKDEKMHFFKEKSMAIVPHGHYLPVYPVWVSNNEARKLLGLPLNKKILLFFGALRPYKGLEELLAAAKELSYKDLFLLIAGKPLSEEYKKSLLHMAKGASHIRFHSEYIPDDEVPTYFGAADLVVLPYKEILNSGTAFLALTFGVPILVPQLGSLVELSRRYPTLVHAYDPPLTAKKLEEALERIDVLGSEQSNEWEKYLREHDWDRIAEQTLAFYLKVTKLSKNEVF